MDMTMNEAMVLEYRALKCLKQGEDNPKVAGVARKFAERAVHLLHSAKFFDEAAGIYKKLIDNNGI